MKKIILVFFFLIPLNFSYAQEKIVYLDINFLLSQSEVGKDVNNYLKKINEKNNNEFKKIESDIKKNEENILKQKNILKKEDFEKKIADLRIKYQSYQEQKKNKNIELNKLRNNAGKKILKHINEILTNYSQSKSISMIIDKKNIIIGKTDLDVTNDILLLLNKKVQKIQIKNE
tara:strand:+ start:846 stop:1367 length:522 start_codon:yes stop_codon:yes gene_type:complete